ncbi:MAG: hypothetical protein G01um101433_903 [Parcubacteria group bacterium Gr01-1014_33]|nr:MAG: hypothetical protein G01um101433_903 [Parcubacteria group bacterium Gr01-1014_33]
MAPLKIFLDANIFIAATASSRGGSRLILELGKGQKVKLVTVTHALVETERNVREKLGEEYLDILYHLLLESQLEVQSITSVTPEEILFWEGVLPPKDIPILLGALYSRSSFLVTLDRKDFISNKKLDTRHLPFKIVTPGDFIQHYV